MLTHRRPCESDHTRRVPETPAGGIVRIGHPAGVIETESRVERSGDDLVVRRATLGRTARRILEGYVYVPDGECS